MSIKRYMIRRLLQLIPVLFGVTILVYAFLFFSPGDPVVKKLTGSGVAVSSEVIEKTREEMGLNDPFLLQYGRWLANALRGDLGTSYKDGLPVVEKLAKGLKNTMILALVSLLAGILCSFPLGVAAALKQNRFVDYFIRFLSFFGNSLPNFLISVLLMYFLCIKIKVFPIMASQTVKGLFLPALTLTIPITSRLVRQIRAEVLEQLHQPYVTGARTRGVKQRFILLGNVLHNSMLPIVTLYGLEIGSLMTGSVVVETIFLWPGVGKLVMDSITARDYPVIQGFVILMAVIYVITNLITDLLYHKLDPRIMEEQGME